MRISDWSSDVCSSDLRTQDRHGAWTPRRESSTFVIALHRQKRGYIGRQRLPWTGNRVVSREHRPPDGLADRTFSHSCHSVFSGTGVDLADALVEFLLSGSLDKNVEAVIAEHLRILGAAGHDFRSGPELLLCRYVNQSRSSKPIVHIERCRGLCTIERLDVMVERSEEHTSELQTLMRIQYSAV